MNKAAASDLLGKNPSNSNRLNHSTFIFTFQMQNSLLQQYVAPAYLDEKRTVEIVLISPCDSHDTSHAPLVRFAPSTIPFRTVLAGPLHLGRLDDNSSKISIALNMYMLLMRHGHIMTRAMARMDKLSLKELSQGAQRWGSSARVS